MKPITFPQANRVWAENQPPYLPLPAYYTDEKQTISCWQLSWLERLWLLIHGKLWLRQMNFGHKLQPQLIEIQTPFLK